MATIKNPNSPTPWQARVNPRGQPAKHLGCFATMEQALKVEDDWWADPRNVSYEQWLRRFNLHIRGRRSMTLPSRVLRL